MAIIKVENLGKKYVLSHRAQAPYTALRDVIADNVKAAGKRLLHPFKPHPAARSSSSQEDFWALQDVSFEINQGDRVGIIGRNGAGKSTLLKILSRITEPTRGRVELNGRVASLLEVGTGFHPELTGRENIYLNGAILGMSRVEIKGKFDEIVAFAEVEKFLDTPVKRYSSGMYVRLAFAVAAHLEPEILIVDEVLAVGDAQFQKKCLGKMEDVGKDGRTVLFVSHNMGAIARLCPECIRLESGHLKGFGSSFEIINDYIRDGASDVSVKRWEIDSAPGDDYVKLIKVRVYQPDGNSSGQMEISKQTFIEIEVDVIEEVPELTVSIMVAVLDGYIMLHSANVVNKETFIPSKGKWVIRCTLPQFLLNVGTYAFSFAADVPHQWTIFDEDNLLVVKFDTAAVEMGRYSHEEWKGIVGPAICQWTQNKVS